MNHEIFIDGAVKNCPDSFILPVTFLNLNCFIEGIEKPCHLPTTYDRKKRAKKLIVERGYKKPFVKFTPLRKATGVENSIVLI